MHYRVAIVGSGPAGWTAALYAARADLAPIVIEGAQPGGQLMITTDVENYPGFPAGIQGPELMVVFREQAVRFGTEVLLDIVTDVDFEARPFRLTLDSGLNLTADAIIIASGASAKALGIASERQPGVSACAVCDGALPVYRGKELVVVGGGDTAMEEATFLTKFATEVAIIHRRNEFRASKIMLERAQKNEKIKWITPVAVEEVHGVDQGTVTGLRLRNLETGETWDHKTDALFLAIGHIPNTKIFKGQLELDAQGYIISHGGAKTNIEGVFHAGDVQDRVYRQAVTAAGMGCMAAIEAERFLESTGH
jgi:thioredoxin reductase (NADPH)